MSHFVFFKHCSFFGGLVFQPGLLVALELVIIARLLQEATLALEGVEVATREDMEVRVDLEEVRLFSSRTALLYSAYFSTEDESFQMGL